MKEIPPNRQFLDDEQESDIGVMSPMKLGNRVDGFQRKGQAWFVATELQSDLVVEIDELKFHLHKFPLLSRSGRLNRLVFESRDTEKDHIKLVGLPGGPDTFELAAKFCYGIAIDLTASNVAALRAAAEYLEMTEDLEEGNLISKTEAFLSFVVLASWKDSITVLKSCELIAPWAESLQIVRRCSESIAWKACTDPRGINWSFTATKATPDGKDESPVWKGVDGDLAKQVPQDWWFEDASTLSIHHFSRVIAAIKVKGMRPDLMGAAITYYATKWIPALSKDHGLSVGENLAENRIQLTRLTGKEDIPILHTKSQLLVEAIISILPPQKEAVSCSFLLRLLRIANMQNASASCRTELEKRIGLQLENAQLNDLLIPSFTHTSETLYDIDLMQRIVEYFKQQDNPIISPESFIIPDNVGYDLNKGQTTPSNPKMKVARILDSYLAEIARDTNLSLAKFQALAESLPDYARISDDGLYRAIDTYLKAHPGLSEQERKRLCRAMDCQKLSSDACVHASQNERLPLRTVVQVIFNEQLKLKNSLAVSPLLNEQNEESRMMGRASGAPRLSMSHIAAGAHKHQQLLNTDELVATRRELRAVKNDVQEMKDKFCELQRDYALVLQRLEKLSRSKTNHSSWSLGWKKLSSKLTSSHKLHQRELADGHSGEVSLTPDPSAARKPRRWRNSIS